MQLRNVAYNFCISFVLSSIGQSSGCVADENVATAGGRLQQSVIRASLVSALFDEEIVAQNVFAVRHRYLMLSMSGRYDYLANWVLPSETHAAIRLSGAFTPTEVVPLTPKEYLDSDGSGGELVSPVFDLLDAARSLGRLEDLRGRVGAIPPARTEAQQRARAAMLVLLAMELNDEVTVAAEVNRLRALVTVAVPASMSDQWPETLVAYRSVTRFPKSTACDVVKDLVAYQLQRGIPRESAEWHSQIFSLAGRLKTQQISGTDIATESTDVLKNWIPIARTRWIRDAAGVAKASWRWRGDECNHVTGRDEDYLFYRSPLTISAAQSL